MHRPAPYAAVLLALAALAACADQTVAPIALDEPAAPAAPHPPSFSRDAALAEIEGSHLVRFSSGQVPDGFAAAVAAQGGTVTFAHGGAGVAAVSGLSTEGAAALAGTPGVRDVLPDDATQIAPPGFEATIEAASEATIASPAAPQTSFFYARQWNMRAIGADLAWAAGRLGSPSVRVAILDTGLGYTHADLNGRVDLANSVSLNASDNTVLPSLFPGAHPVADLHYHGTHVAATVASNAVASAGVTSGVRLVGVKVCNRFGTCPTSAVLQGILYATDLGVDVINMSLGGPFLRRDVSAAGGNGPSFIATINDVFNYARRGGVTVVVTANNDNADLDHNGNAYEAYCNAPHVICVSATGPTAAPTVNGPFTNVDARASYSNYGRSAVTVAAPGGTGQNAAPVNRAFVWAACSRFSLQVPVCQTGTFALGINGTSMAAPHVAGLAALIVEDVGRDPAKVRARLQQTADDLGEPGTDPIYGKGRINVARALGVN